jgi:[ribosomal protein S5]-alanine N-acetyltransferase
MASFELVEGRVEIRRPMAADCDEFLALVRSSQDLHRPWVEPPSTRQRYEAYLESRQWVGDDGFFVCDSGSGSIVGVVNLNCIVRGFFHSAYLGYYVGAAFAGRGYMTEGLKLVARFAFTEMGLHRLEANIQPENVASIALVRKCGFRKEGFSPRYLRVMGEWRDHERWALLADETDYLKRARNTF